MREGGDRGDRCCQQGQENREPLERPVLTLTATRGFRGRKTSLCVLITTYKKESRLIWRKRQAPKDPKAISPPYFPNSSYSLWLIEGSNSKHNPHQIHQVIIQTQRRHSDFAILRYSFWVRSEGPFIFYSIYSHILSFFVFKEEQHLIFGIIKKTVFTESSVSSAYSFYYRGFWVFWHHHNGTALIYRQNASWAVGGLAFRGKVTTQTRQ